MEQKHEGSRQAQNNRTQVGRHTHNLDLISLSPPLHYTLRKLHPISTHPLPLHLSLQVHLFLAVLKTKFAKAQTIFHAKAAVTQGGKRKNTIMKLFSKASKNMSSVSHGWPALLSACYETHAQCPTASNVCTVQYAQLRPTQSLELCKLLCRCHCCH